MPIIELDILIAFVNKADKLHNVAIEIFNKITTGELKGIIVPTSAYIEYELILKSRGYSEDDVRSDIEAFKRVKNLGEVPLTSNIIVKASKLRETYGLTYFDSLHAASALLYDKTIISIDEAYRRVPKLKVLDPREAATF